MCKVFVSWLDPFLTLIWLHMEKRLRRMPTCLYHKIRSPIITSFPNIMCQHVTSSCSSPEIPVWMFSATFNPKNELFMTRGSRIGHLLSLWFNSSFFHVMVKFLTGAAAAVCNMDAEETHFGVRSQSRSLLPGLRHFITALILSLVSQWFGVFS